MQLQLDEIRRRLGEQYNLEYHPEISSTNDRAMDLARNGAQHLTVVMTDFQSAGRGRRGATWSAPAESSVLCSLLFRPNTTIPNHHLAILAGVGVANGLKKLDAPVKIKWPNDIMLNDKKLAGILVETVGDAVVVGVGVNCNIPPESFPEELQQRAISLHTATGKTLSRELILSSMISYLVDAFTRVETGGVIKVLAEWNTFNWLSRRKVRVTGPMGVVDGDGLFLDGRKLVFHVFKDYGVVPMPLASSVEAR